MEFLSKFFRQDPAVNEPVALIVTVVVNPDRMDEFMEILKGDVEGSRQEAGCLRFDFLRGEKPNTFIFYECYRDKAAIEFHKDQPHYVAYAKFREEGGITSRDAVTARAIDFQTSA